MTAQQFHSEEYQLIEFGYLLSPEKELKEFAALHVKAALEVASEKANLIRYWNDTDGNGDVFLTKDNEDGYYSSPYLENSGCAIVVNKKSILEAYPEENIK